MRRMLGVVQDIDSRQAPRSLIIVVAAGVQVSVETRKVAAGDLQADAMAGAEVIACGIEVDHHFARLSSENRVYGGGVPPPRPSLPNLL